MLSLWSMVLLAGVNPAPADPPTRPAVAVPEDWSAKLGDPDAKVRRLTAERVGRAKLEAAAGPLGQLLGDKDPDVRGAAVTALTRLGAKAVPVAAAALAGTDLVAHRPALEVLDRLGGERASPAAEQLASALASKDTDVRIVAASLLGEIGPTAKAALPALFEAAKDTANLGPVFRKRYPAAVAPAAVTAALSIDPGSGPALAKASLPSLTEALKSKDVAVVQAAASALANLGTHAAPALPALREALPRAKGFDKSEIEAAIAAAAGQARSAALWAVVKDESNPMKDRIEALRTLSFTDPDPGAVPTLASALGDKDPAVRAAAADVARWFGPKAEKAIPAALALLGDAKVEEALRDGTTPQGVGDILAEIGPAAVTGLAKALTDPDRPPLARIQAAEGLARLARRSGDTVKVLKAGMGDRLLPVAVLSAAGYAAGTGDLKAASPLLREGLRSKSEYVAHRTARAIEDLGPMADALVPDLRTLLGHDHPEVRIAAAHALAALGPAAATAAADIGKLLAADDGRVRFQAARALEKFGPSAAAAVPALIERLDDPEGVSPNPILSTLGNVGPKAAPAAPKLISILKAPADSSRPSSRRQQAAVVLGRIGPAAKEAVPVLVGWLSRRSEQDVAAAARGLGLIGPDAKAAVPALTALTDDPRPSVRVAVAFALARITGDPGPHVAALIDLWEEEEAGPRGGFGGGYRFDVAEALTDLGPAARPARDVLLDGLTGGKLPAGTAQRAAAALGQMADDAAAIVPRLAAFLDLPKDKYDWSGSATAAANALAEFGPRAKAAVPALRKLTGHPDDELAKAADRAIRRIESR